MAQILLASQVLHAADQPRFDPLRRRPLHAFWRLSWGFLDPLPQPLPHLAIDADERTPTYFRVSGSAISAKAGLPRSRSTPRSSNSLSVKDFVFSQLVVGPLRYLLSRRFDTIPSRPA
ncbi:hypothetical protein, partial [Mesorhizobium sp.]|uniref:hypothetical protein n=1 Tax=Mesorhizobium sp. TaxID=1871066 RepID=UPI00257F383E